MSKKRGLNSLTPVWVMMSSRLTGDRFTNLNGFTDSLTEFRRGRVPSLAWHGHMVSLCGSLCDTSFRLGGVAFSWAARLPHVPVFSFRQDLR